MSYGLLGSHLIYSHGASRSHYSTWLTSWGSPVYFGFTQHYPVSNPVIILVRPTPLSSLYGLARHRPEPPVRPKRSGPPVFRFK